jgi:hypothetical protein
MVDALIGFTDIARKALILPSFGATASGRVGQGSNSPNFVHAHCCACSGLQLAHRDLASRIHVRNATESGQT